MKLSVEISRLSSSPPLFLRHAGYHQIFDRDSGQESYVRRLTRDFYPRFHIYIEAKDETIIFNLHLDQKRPVYRGAPHAHNAEYDGQVVAEEIERLKVFLKIKN